MIGRSLLAAEPPQPQDLVIMILGLYMRPAHAAVWSGGLVALLEELGFSRGAARIALARLVNRKLTKRVRHGRLISYSLTERGESVLAEGDRRILTLGLELKPPDVWTILVHQLPEERRLERQRLALRLRFLGFGSLQDGVWVSPGDRGREVTPVLEELRIESHVALFTGRRLPFATYPLIERVWDLPALAARYSLFSEEFAPFAEQPGQRALSDAQAFAVRTIMVHLYRGFAFLDPNLPDEAMPDRTARARAAGIFRDAYAALAQPAQRHFDSTMKFQ